MPMLNEIIISIPGIIFLIFNMFFMFAIFTYKKINLSKKASNDLPKVSVIIAAWNEGKRIERCINSVLKLNYPKKNLEIIVSGGGTDETSIICKKLAKKGIIKYIEEKERRGKWYALNSAVDFAKYDYLAFTDADCVVTKNWLKSLVAHSKDADIVVSSINALHDDGIIGKSYAIATAYCSLMGYGLTRFFKSSAFSGTGSFMKKSIAKEIKFPKSLVEDYRFCFLAIRKGYKVRHALDSLVYYGRPRSFSDWKKCYLRIFHGILSEMISLRDPFPYLMIATGILSLIGLIVIVITPVIQGTIIFVVNLISITLTLVNVSMLDRIFNSKSSLLRFPYLVIFFYFEHLIGIESFFRWLMKRDIGWPIYNKT